MIVMQSTVGFDLTELGERLNQKGVFAQTLERTASGQLSIDADSSVTLLGHAGGIYDTVFSPLRMIALFGSGDFHVYAAVTTEADNPVLVAEDGVYFVPLAQADHLLIANPSSTEAVRVRFYLGGDAYVAP